MVWDGMGSEHSRAEKVVRFHKIAFQRFKTTSRIRLEVTISAEEHPKIWSTRDVASRKTRSTPGGLKKIWRSCPFCPYDAPVLHDLLAKRQTFGSIQNPVNPQSVNQMRNPRISQWFNDQSILQVSLPICQLFVMTSTKKSDNRPAWCFHDPRRKSEKESSGIKWIITRVLVVASSCVLSHPHLYKKKCQECLPNLGD